MGALLVVLAACSNGRRGDDIGQTTAVVVPAEIGQQAAKWNVAGVRVIVPAELEVSEANSYYPRGDIVWRDDPPGDRRAQVAKLMFDGISDGLKHLNGPQDVDFQITVRRFHSLSEKTRASVGGVHNMRFTLAVIDRATGTQIVSPILFEPDLNAYGGAQATAAERRGDTQKVRIKRHLGNVMRLEFPGNLPPNQRIRGLSAAALGPAKTAVVSGRI